MKKSLRMFAGVGVLAAVLLAGCGDDDDVGADTTTTTVGDGSTTTTTTGGGGDDDGSTTTTTTGDGIDPFDDGGFDPVEEDATASGISFLTDVTVGRHEGFDRVVFTFSGNGVPGYRVEYVDPPIIADGSGEEIDVNGDFFLHVRMEPAAGFNTETGLPTYNGPSPISGSSAGTSQIREVERTGDFEAVVGWAIGLSDRVAFRVDTLTSPSRLVVDVQNH